MARSRETKIELTAYDDLFQTDESREEAKLSKIRDIPISEIDEFPDHPFKVLMDEDMEQLVESIKRNGVMTPATVRLKEDGRYELISGHRRKKACELAGLETLKCEVKELTRDEAIIVMVESNLQRSVILPSEKAFAYKMRLEAMKRQAGRPPKENASPLATNLSKGRSDEELGELVGESKDQIRRYIRLIEAVKELVSDKYFAKEIEKRIGVQTDTTAIDKELVNYESKLKEVDLNKARLEREIDNLPIDARFRERKIHDMTLRLDALYDTIVELEERIEDAKLRKSSIEMETITLDNIYKLMLNFGKLYDIISDEEKKNLITYLIKEIQIYPNGESEMPLKSIEFNFPIYRDGQEVRRLLWEKGNTVECVCALSRR